MSHTAALLEIAKILRLMKGGYRAKALAVAEAALAEPPVVEGVIAAPPVAPAVDPQRESCST